MAAAVQKAIDTNPEVTARLNALRAANNEVDVARGAYYPTLDLSAGVGRNRDEISSRSPQSISFTRTGVALTANQVLWDGRLTSKEVERLGHASTVRYFEFLAATEDTALEAARAYLDVLRFRKLVLLAEDNYIQHRYVSDQLQSKFKAGVGRGVDSEQANARLALAESNLTTEISNLHDFSARFLRLIGEVPASTLPAAPNLESSIKADNAELIAQALAKNASISAAVENLRAAQAEASSKESPFQPRVEARVRTGAGNNFDGLLNRRGATSAEILLNWNLYRGGSDTARVKQFADLINQAADQRDKVCRDVRQTAAIAQNDINRARLQLAALDRNVLAIGKARDAYRQQFDIGQRSLLDLLNAENELYTAKRAFANADIDQQLAHVRTQAARNTLVANLGLSRSNDDQADLVKDWQAASDAAQRCPAISVDVPFTPREELDARARKLANVAPAPVAVPTPTPATTTPIAADAAAVQTVTQRLAEWAASWRAKDVGRHLAFYSKSFAPARSTNAKWETERRRLVGKPGPIDLKIEGVKGTAKTDTVQTSFIQTYTSSNFNDRSDKVLTWRQEANQWVIVKESNR
jgi:adhesin transport system outer membrane protein